MIERTKREEESYFTFIVLVTPPRPQGALREVPLADKMAYSEEDSSEYSFEGGQTED